MNKIMFPSDNNEKDLFSLEIPAQEEPLVKGQYLCRYAGASTGETERGNPYIRISFEVVDGPRTGYRLYHKYFFTEKTIRRSRAELEKHFMISSQEHIEKSVLPKRSIFLVTVVVQTSDIGNQFNVVKAVKRGLVPDGEACPWDEPETAGDGADIEAEDDSETVNADTLRRLGIK